MYKELVTAENLPEYFYIELCSKFKKILFENAKGNKDWQHLANKLGYSNARMYCLRKGYRIVCGKKEMNLININLLKKICKISHIPMQETKKYISSVRIGRGKCFRLKLPIYESSQLAAIIAHSMGDGHISNNAFTYSNSKKELIEEVKDDVRTVFGNIEPLSYTKEKVTTIYFPVVVARLLCMCGGIKYNKTLQEMDIPNWIKNASPEIKSRFIRALFDDESSVDIEHRNIIVNMSNNIKFLLSISEILKEFGIKCTLSAVGEYKDKKNNTKVMCGLRVGKLENLEKYYKHIGFCHIEKQNLMQGVLENFKNVHYLYDDIEKRMINALSIRGPLTTKDLMEELNRSDETIRVHLNNLCGRDIVTKINDYPSTWKIR